MFTLFCIHYLHCLIWPSVCSLILLLIYKWTIWDLSNVSILTELISNEAGIQSPCLTLCSLCYRVTLPVNGANPNCENELLNLSIHICIHFICSFIHPTFVKHLDIPRTSPVFRMCSPIWDSKKVVPVRVGQDLMKWPIRLEIFKTQENPIRQVHAVPEKTLVDTLEKRAAWKQKVTMTNNTRAGVWWAVLKKAVGYNSRMWVSETNW